MAQYVFEFGAEDLKSIHEAIVTTAAKQLTDIQVLMSEDAESLNYRRSDKALDLEFDCLESGKNVSILVRTEVPTIRYGLIVAPHFNRQALSLWMGTIESTDPDWSTLWESLLSQKGLRFACLGYEEGVEIEDMHLTEATFPWTEWPMVIGALRTDPMASGEWIIKANPEYAHETRPRD